MKIKVLGARQGESTNSHCACLIIDGELAIDAGALTSGLSLDEQAAIHTVLISHRHYDHIKDLATFGFNRMGRGQAAIYCTEEVKAALERTVLNEMIWLDFFTLPSPTAPTFRYHRVEPEESFEVNGLRVRPVAVPHTVPSLGYLIASPTGTALYSGDSGQGASATWVACKPDLLLAEVTFCNADTTMASRFGHLSPQLLEKELRVLGEALGKLPRIAVVHVNPFHQGEIEAEVRALARELSAELWVPEEGSTIQV